MRTIVVDRETDLESIAKRLVRNGEIRAGALEKLVAINPHIDARRVEPGTVVLVPEGVGFADSESTSVSAESFDRVREELLDAVDAAAARMLASHDAVLEEGREIGALLKSATMSRAIQSEPQLKVQVEDAAAMQKHDQQMAKEARAVALSLRELAEAELTKLGKIFAA